MEVTDIILGGILLYGLGRGIWKGFFVELASLLSLLLGLFIAVKFSGYLAGMLAEHVSWQPRYISITSFVLLFVAVIIGISLLAKTLTKMADATGLGFLNRIMGGVFGFIKMLLIVSILLNFFVKINRNHTIASREALQKSVLFYPVLQISAIIFPVLEVWFNEFKEGQDLFFQDEKDEDEKESETEAEEVYPDNGNKKEAEEADPDLFQRA
ncbi:CvpA family protein [Flavobacterium rhizosphaerae]|uniref:CvpA family protein n=1 Tax=Flavobacterium rhizosphaerae TaxID=3163298 RepID=A0ABW8YZK5_9FLAO